MTGRRPGDRDWAQVWDSRRLAPPRGSVLSQLLAADGFDTAFGGVDEAAWRDFVLGKRELLGLDAGQEVFEVGCGAGAFLYVWREAGCRVAGVDQSATLIDIARTVMPDGTFTVGDAASVEPAPKVDAVVSMGVFLYFPSLAYAEAVLDRMCAKARRAVAILDVPDLARRDAALAFRIAAAGGPAAYAERYSGLDHLYYDREWFEHALRARGLERVSTADQDLPDYPNGEFRFNAWGFVPDAAVGSRGRDV